MIEKTTLFAAAVLLLPGISQADDKSDIVKFGTTYWMAQECHITLRPEVGAWLEKLADEFNTDDVAALRPVVEAAVRNKFAADGKLSSCISLRAALYRDGWL
ncbi:hypothetical protein SAMN05880590_10132 [Rhizobium sp. RU35A]|uniref:hypothetical protein n=1 Tax=Rhizobium sp. RU35A TaxID=1907414 RepID=UPI0009565457|nr:hypothetical protein [Rhizobium sp. RU35A]SIP89228.1 hypothetical protein SAMN05880590_10132 [Rhizobium sp. RU35A]